MATSGGGRKVRPELVVAIIGVVVTALGLVPRWVPFLEAEGWDAGWLRDLLRWLHQWWRVLFVLAVVLLVSYAAWAWRGLVIQGAKRVRRAGDELYSWLLSSLVVKPAADRYGIEVDPFPDIYDYSAEWVESLPATLRLLSMDALTVLGGAIVRRRPGKVEVVVKWPTALRLDPLASGSEEAGRRFEEALEELEKADARVCGRVLKKGEEGDIEVSVSFKTSRYGWKLWERVYALVTTERVRRELRQEMEGMARVSKPSVDPTEKAACREKIADLSGHAVSVLEYLLRLYLTRAGPVIQEDVSDPEILMSPLKSLTRAHLEAALEELVDEGFLEECKWDGETLQVRVTECLSKRSVAEVVFEWLQDLMAEGRRASH